ncbi:MAG: riboflavin synthase [Acidobacteria bacterium]|nr:riboflavin synthase [Acidobacteriota bacterium]
MFTGIIEETGTIKELKRGTQPEGGARIVVSALQALQDGPSGPKLTEGESIAVNGVCLTARDITAEAFSADLAPETLKRSSLGALTPGSRVNLERAMTASSRFGGHIVQGHVDGVGTSVALDSLPDGNFWLTVEIPAELERYIVWKGSIALNGTSLTVASLEGNRVGVAIIPHTFEQTILRDLKPGDPINIECDVIAKHVEKLLSTIEIPSARKPKKESSLTMEKLIEEGF